MYSGPCITRRCNNACGKMYQRDDRSTCSETHSRNFAELPECFHSSAKYFRYRYRSERVLRRLFSQLFPFNLRPRSSAPIFFCGKKLKKKGINIKNSRGIHRNHFCTNLDVNARRTVRKKYHQDPLSAVHAADDR